MVITTSNVEVFGQQQQTKARAKYRFQLQSELLAKQVPTKTPRVMCSSGANVGPEGSFQPF